MRSFAGCLLLRLGGSPAAWVGLLFLSFLGPGYGSDGVSEPVGVLRLELPAESQRLVALPFEAPDASVGQVLRGQLVGAATWTAADRIAKWDAANQQYVYAFLAADTGDSNKDGNWYVDSESWTPSTMTL